MRLRLLSLLLPCLLLTACAAPEEVETRPKQYQATFLDVFDTVTTVMLSLIHISEPTRPY